MGDFLLSLLGGHTHQPAERPHEVDREIGSRRP
jgi:hypothetical protein